jgi:hypothetical protein
MSFEFDPNLNIDRVEDDNDPQDNDSLAGGDGLFGRVPLPIERQVQAQARGGVGQARGGPVPRNAGQAPSLLLGLYNILDRYSRYLHVCTKIDPS